MRKPCQENESAGQVVPLEKARAVANTNPMGWRAFKRLTEDCDELRESPEKLTGVFHQSSPTMTIASLERDAEYCRNLVARCEVGLARFDDMANYEAAEDDEEFVELS